MRLSLLLLLVPCLLLSQVKTDSTVLLTSITGQDLWLAKDKADHLVASAFLVGFGYYLSRQELNRSHAKAAPFSVGFSFSFGIAKEIYDGAYRHGKASWKDLVADLAGCAIGYAVISAGNR
jgi:putative lipoprotein